MHWCQRDDTYFSSIRKAEAAKIEINCIPILPVGSADSRQKKAQHFLKSFLQKKGSKSAPLLPAASIPGLGRKGNAYLDPDLVS